MRRIAVGGVAALACLAAPAVARAGTLSAMPSPVQFGTQIAGNGGGGSQTVTIINDNTSATTIGALSFSGPDAKEFQLNSDSCSGQTLVTMGQCNVNVQWNPQVPGVKSAQLNVANDGSINR